MSKALLVEEECKKKQLRQADKGKPDAHKYIYT